MSNYSSLFGLGRTKPFPSNYGENKTPVTVDVLESGWIVSFFALYFCFLVLVPAVPGKQKIFYLVRITSFLFVGLVIMVINFGQEWEVGYIESNMAYKSGIAEEIHATVGMKLGLRAVNITLKGEEPYSGVLENETIDYNERYYFVGPQGRFGFGKFAGQIQRDFRESQYKGTPYPILWVAEFFTFDGEGLRYGRNYRLAGLYAELCVWLAFPSWIICGILFKLVIPYGAMMLSFVGCLLLTSSLIWAFRRNSMELAILFESGVLETHYGPHWYLALIVGILCIIVGVVLKILDRNYHDELCKWINVDPLQYYQEEIEEEVIEAKATPQGDIEMAPLGNQKRIKRTITFRSKGRSHAARNFASTVVVEELPENHLAMEQAANEWYAETPHDVMKERQYPQNQYHQTQRQYQNNYQQFYQQPDDQQPLFSDNRAQYQTQEPYELAESTQQYDEIDMNQLPEPPALPPRRY